MHLKTYKAPDLASALAMARAELGPDALVLATNEIKGGLGLTTVEITVAAERAAPAAPLPLAHEERAVAPIAREMPRVAPEAMREPRRTPRRIERRAERGAEPAPSLRGASLALVRAGLSKELAMRFARIAFSHGASRGVGDEVAGQALAEIVAVRPLERARTLFVVGPPGCGKTTTAAKLAARWTLDGARDVVLAQADADRVGAVEQASLFARHLGLRHVAIRAASDLAALDGRTGLGSSILVDTAGVGERDRERLERLAELRRTARAADVAVLLPAGLHRDAARRILDRFAPLEPTHVVLSKVDDGVRVGELVTAVEPTGLPIALVTTGHRVPYDLEDASPSCLANLLFRSGFEPVEETSRAV
jgi:flagellar biosynthesis protein FlhF